VVLADVSAAGAGVLARGGFGGGDGGARFATLDGLGRLVDRSLVVADHVGSTRYRMLETIRQYAADQLAASGETVALRDRHLDFFRRLALDAEQGLKGPESAMWLGRLDAELDNVRGAVDWAFESRPEAGLEMCVAMIRYWQSRTMGSEGYDRVLQAVDRVRALPEPASVSANRTRSSFIARALSGAAIIASMGGRASTISLGEEAVAAARESRDPAAMADALYVWLFRAGDHAPAGRRADWRLAAAEALAIVTDLGDWGRLSRLELSLAMIEAPLDPAAAERWLDRATESARRSGNPQEIAYLAQVRGRVASMTGRLTEAQRWFRESQARFQAIDDHRFELSARSELGHALRRDDRIDEAEAEYRQSIRGWQRSGNRGAVANQLEAFAFLALTRKQGVRAARLFGAAEALREVRAAVAPILARRLQEAQV